MLLLTSLLDEQAFRKAFRANAPKAVLESVYMAGVSFEAWHKALAVDVGPAAEDDIALLHRIVRKFSEAELIEPHPWVAEKIFYQSTFTGRIALRDGTYGAYVEGLVSVVQGARASVFLIHTPGHDGVGSGFLVHERYVATAAHVVDGLVSGFVVEDERQRQWNVLRIVRHPELDIALIELAAPCTEKTLGLQVFPLDLLEEVVMLGFPPIPWNTRNTLVANRGEMAGRVTLRGEEDGYVISCIARGGNSGGPVLATDGVVAGLISQNLFRQPTGDDQPASEALGYSYAIPSVYVLGFLNDTLEPNREKPRFLSKEQLDKALSPNREESEEE